MYSAILFPPKKFLSPSASEIAEFACQLIETLLIVHIILCQFKNLNTQKDI